MGETYGEIGHAPRRSADVRGDQSGADPMIERCRREIAAIEAEILAGNPDLQGLCLALSDWSAELRLIEKEITLPA